MCMSSGPAKFSTTKIYVGEAEKDNKLVHVIAYQNNAESLYDVPNAMILPFPTSVPMTDKNVIDTSKFKGFLQDITDASKFQGKMMGTRRSLVLGSAGLAKVFDVGSYTVVLATNAGQISEALTRVPEEKRPTITSSLLKGFDTLYPDQPIAVCCWHGTVEAEPLLWWYEPKDQDTLFVPTMDAHDGLAPKVEANVDTDHTISVGTAYRNRNVSRNKVNYKTAGRIPPSVKGLLPDYVWGVQLPRRMKNGDMFLKTAELRANNDGRLHIPDLKRGVNATRTHSTVQMYGWSA